MSDQDVIEMINRLADEEHDLERASRTEPLQGDDKARLESLVVALDQCYDLLRQRRARRSAGLDPDTATTRSAEIVEGYQQ